MTLRNNVALFAFKWVHKCAWHNNFTSEPSVTLMSKIQRGYHLALFAVKCVQINV